jgi:hypothetical protein
VRWERKQSQAPGVYLDLGWGLDGKISKDEEWSSRGDIFRSSKSEPWRVLKKFTRSSRLWGIWNNTLKGEVLGVLWAWVHIPYLSTLSDFRKWWRGQVDERLYFILSKLLKSLTGTNSDSVKNQGGQGQARSSLPKVKQGYLSASRVARGLKQRSHGSFSGERRKGCKQEQRFLVRYSRRLKQSSCPASSTCRLHINLGLRTC